MPYENTNTTGEKKSWIPPMSNSLYKGLNLFTVSFGTAATVLAVDTPVTTMILNHVQKGKFLPPSCTAGRAGALAMLAGLYTGVRTQAVGSVARSGYVTNAKQISVNPLEKSNEIEASNESIQENKNRSFKSFQELSLVASFALGEVIVTHPFDTKRHLSVLNVTNEHFNWKGVHNAFKLCTAHIGPRYTAGLINFGSLLIASNQIAKQLPIENKTVSHITSGALSGAFAAATCFPLSYYRDRALSEACVVNGRLTTMKATSIASHAYNFVKDTGFSDTLSYCYKAFKPQLISRMARTALIFACVEGVSNFLGQEPLKEIIPETGKPGSNSFSLFSRKPEKNSTPSPSITEIKEEDSMTMK